ncbi:MAG: hypothetical protein JWM16_4177 [Verrucomicrobiales bacterium]|nr:hypothetical protein [Verrucomicrobiales bacterium]
MKGANDEIRMTNDDPSPFRLGGFGLTLLAALDFAFFFSSPAVAGGLIGLVLERSAEVFPGTNRTVWSAHLADVGPGIFGWFAGMFLLPHAILSPETSGNSAGVLPEGNQQ